MDTQDFRSLQEAYMDVYEGKSSRPRYPAGRGVLDQETRDEKREASAENMRGHTEGPGTVTKNPKKLRKQKSMGELGEQKNIYDIILSHLIDEGYADTEEAAKAIMVNMSEGAAGDVAARAQKLANQKKGQTPERKKMYQDLAYKARSRERGDGDGSPRTSRFERSKDYGSDITPMVSQSKSSKETLGGGTYERGPKRLPKSKEKYRRQVATGVRAASSQEKKRLGIKEDIYDIILSHLLDEGYAETPEAAERIMVNMSEGWIGSIIG